MRYAAKRYQGAREYQQDDYGVIEGSDLQVGGKPQSVFVVADGMGGHSAGDVASQTAIRAFVESYHTTTGPTTDRLRECVERANAALGGAIASTPELTGMGTTMVAVAMTEDGIEWVSVGDSTLRVFDASAGTLRRVNADHSMVPVLEAMVSAAHLTRQEMEDDPSRNVLRSALTGADISMVDVSSQPLTLQPDDCVLLASDGLDVLEEQRIASLIAAHGAEGPESIVDALILAVDELDAVGQDNVTVLVCAPGNAMPRRSVAPDSAQRRRVWIVGVLAVAVVLGAIFTWWRTPDNRSAATAPTTSDASAIESMTSIESLPESEPPAEAGVPPQPDSATPPASKPSASRQ